MKSLRNDRLTNTMLIVFARTVEDLAAAARSARVPSKIFAIRGIFGAATIPVATSYASTDPSNSSRTVSKIPFQIWPRLPAVRRQHFPVIEITPANGERSFGFGCGFLQQFIDEFEGPFGTVFAEFPFPVVPDNSSLIHQVKARPATHAPRFPVGEIVVHEIGRAHV